MPSLLYETTGHSNNNIVWNRQVVTLPKGRFQVQFVFTMGHPFESAAGLDSVKLIKCPKAKNVIQGLPLPGRKNVGPIQTGDLTHWGRVTHICVSNLTIIVSDNGLSPGRHQSHYPNQCCFIVNWNLRKKFQWIIIEIKTFSVKNMQLKMSSGKWRPFCSIFHVLA